MQSTTFRTVAELSRALAAREVSAVELAQDYLARIEAHKELNCFLDVRPEVTLEQAREADKRIAEGTATRLTGIPIAHKDIFVTRKWVSTAASRMLEGYMSPFDAAVVKKLDAAGMVTLGKLNCDEFAMGSANENSAYGKVFNPWNVNAVPGGSSGGSSACVAAGLAPIATATDTGGSIREPAAFCGVTGLKPTYGRVSRYGVIAYGSSLDQVGPLARTVEDAALVLSVIAGHDKRDSTSSPRPVDNYADFSRADLKGVRLGVPREFMAEGLDGPVAKACQDALDRARDLGAELVDVSLPHATRHAIAAYYIVAMAEASSNLSRFDGVRYGYRAADPKNLDDLYCRSRSEGFGQEVQRRILLGTYVLSAGYYDAYYKKAAQVRRLIRQDYLNALGSCDALFGPVSPVTAWKLGSIIDDPLKMYLMDIYTVSLNLAGLPGLSFPVGEADGLPVGMQLIGRDFDEAGILGIGNVLSK